MKYKVTQTFHKVAGFSLLALAIACGDAADPEAVTRDDLKSPSALKIVDKGNGSIDLRWSTANFEDDFEGYNVYGAVVTDADLTEFGITKGEPIQLLDANGDAVEAARTILANFSYQATNQYALPGTADNAEAEYNLEDKKFSALPYHKLRTATKEANLPTCIPIDGGICDPTGTVKQETEASAITSIGNISYSLPETLAIGSQVCFFVFAVQDEGEEISQSSTDVACIVPKYATAVTTSAGITSGNQIALPLFATLRSACATDGCPEIATTVSAAAISATTTDRTVQFEKFNNNDNLTFATGQNAVILSFGYFENGFADDNFVNLVQSAPNLSGFDATAISQGGGYSQPGQSIVVEKNHIYVIANAAADSATPADADFYYDWIYVSEAACPDTSCNVSYQLLLSANPNTPGR
ncbi:MAG: hypothetical protein HRU19_15725 [Pseudobacteriovorax sp.]|nr:hypothetical protein [Pseudobacteriovorax sp.]